MLRINDIVRTPFRYIVYVGLRFVWRTEYEPYLLMTIVTLLLREKIPSIIEDTISK